MKVNALDHVNIVAADLPGTARFFADLLGLEIRPGPAPMSRDMALWMYDEAVRPIIHLNSVDCPRAFDRDVSPGPTGSIHHVAFNCSGHADFIARVEAMGVDYECNDIESLGLRQVFVSDPNGVLLELNFFS